MAEIEKDFSELADYDEDEETLTKELEDNNTVATSSDMHVAIHTSGFRELLLKPALLKAIGDCGFEHPSAVQHECIPQAILGTDVVCQAKSGMGKTAVFVLSVLQQIDTSEKGVSCLVLGHTRELAHQIGKEFNKFKKYMSNVVVSVFIGGEPVADNRRVLKTNVPHIVIGTPGRIYQLANEGDLKLNKVKHFVLDECDRMLDQLDMRRTVQAIFKMTPLDKQVMMFSATLNPEIRPICKKFMHNPLEIYINDGAKLVLHGLQQYYVKLTEKEKNRKLIDLLDSLEFNQVIIFVSSISRAITLNKLLLVENFPSVCSHSRMSQEERLVRYNKFKTFACRIMIATNIFGRGVDFEGVNVVINYDITKDEDTYLHRVGRAGRFGTKGLAITFCCEGEDAILESVRKKFVVPIPEMPDEIDRSTYMTS